MKDDVKMIQAEKALVAEFKKSIKALNKRSIMPEVLLDLALTNIGVTYELSQAELDQLRGTVDYELILADEVA